MRYIAILILAVSLCCSCTVFSRRAAIPVDALHQPGAESITQLQEYFAKWKQWDTDAEKFTVDSLQPPPPFPELLAHTTAQYDATLPLLTQAMTDRTLTARERDILEKQGTLHLRNALLCRIYRSMDDVRHGRKDAVGELRKYAAALQLRSANGETEVFNCSVLSFSNLLADWDKSFHDALLLPSLNTLWLVNDSETAPEREKMLPLKFSASYGEKLEITLPEGEYLWMHLFFDLPTVAEGRLIGLIMPPLPANAGVFLNERPLPLSAAEKFQILSLKEALVKSDSQHIAVKLPRACIGKALLPPILVSIPEKP